MVRIVDAAEAIWRTGTECTTGINVDGITGVGASEASQGVVAVVDVGEPVWRATAKCPAHDRELSQWRVRTRASCTLPPYAVVVARSVGIEIGAICSPAARTAARYNGCGPIAALEAEAAGRSSHEARTDLMC